MAWRCRQQLVRQPAFALSTRIWRHMVFFFFFFVNSRPGPDEATQPSSPKRRTKKQRIETQVRTKAFIGATAELSMLSYFIPLYPTTPVLAGVCYYYSPVVYYLIQARPAMVSSHPQASGLPLIITCLRSATRRAGWVYPRQVGEAR